jgi:hypothetical protein
MNRTALILSALFVAAPAIVGTSIPVQAQDTVIAAPSAQTVDFPQGILFPHGILDRALKGNVDKNGNVNYAALRDSKDLDLYLQAVATANISEGQFPTAIIPADPKDKNAKPRVDQSAEMVFWINAYNVHILKTIASAYPIDSPDEIKDFDTAKTHRVAGVDYSFAEMRDKITKMDRRAIFALSDGTVGGPLLNPSAYRFADINALLEIAAINFINDDRNVQVNRIGNTVTVNNFLATANDFFATGNIAGGAERKKLTGIRYLLSAYTDERANRSFMTTGDYKLVLTPADRKLNVKRDG